MRKNIVRVVVGLSCLPTATKLNVREPLRSSAFEPGQFTYILESTNPEDLKGGPARVALTSFEPLNEGDRVFTVGDAIRTKHFSEKKNLPSRRVIGVRLPTGECFGEVPIGTLPHWEFMDGRIGTEEVQMRIELNRAAFSTKALKAEQLILVK